MRSLVVIFIDILAMLTNVMIAYFMFNTGGKDTVGSLFWAAGAGWWLCALTYDLELRSR